MRLATKKLLSSQCAQSPMFGNTLVHKTIQQYFTTVNKSTRKFATPLGLSARPLAFTGHEQLQSINSSLYNRTNFASRSAGACFASSGAAAASMATQTGTQHAGQASIPYL